MPKKEVSFEDALIELQSVVDRLEAGKVPLEEALSLYERGMELVKLCNNRLDTAEQRVNAVHITAEGVTLTPFTAEVTP